MFFLALAPVFFSCTLRPSVIENETPPTAIFEELAESRRVEIISALDRVMQRVKQNGEDIPKYFELDEDSNITVKAEFDGCEIVYDLSGAWEDGRIRVDFTVTESFGETCDRENGGKDAASGLPLRDSFLWTPGAGRAGVLLGFDDDYMDTWEQYFDLFDKFGVKVTFFVHGEYDDRLRRFCSEALGRGHDIGYHTLHHTDLRRLSKEQFLAETVSQAAAFRENGVPLKAFAYPFGFSAPWMHDELLKHYGILRGYGVTFRLYNEEGFRGGYVGSRAIDNTVLQSDDDFRKTLTAMLRTAQFIGGGLVLPITTHNISDGPWAIKAERLEYLLKTAGELRLEFYRYCDFARE